MNRFSTWSTRTAALMALGMTAGAIAPIVISAPAMSQNTQILAQNFSTFSDVRSHWARPFIETLAERRIINGYPDGTFKPDQPVTRAEFAALVDAAFSQRAIRTAGRFNDVPTNHWARTAIEKAYSTGFMSGYPNNIFRPNENIPRVQALVSLASGLDLRPTASVSNVLGVYRDANRIPDYALNQVAAATENRMVVNYPNVSELEPNVIATRGEVAAFIHQALVNQGRLQGVASTSDASRYIVGYNSTNPNNTTNSNNTTTSTANRIPQGTIINVLYPTSRRVVVTPGETLNLTMLVASDITNSQNQVLVPRNSEIRGQLVPVYNGSQYLGTQFVAQSIVVGNQSYNNINARSQLFAPQQAANVNPGSLQGAAITTAAQVLLGQVLGTGTTINPGNILGSILTGGQQTTQPQQQEQLIIIEPERDLRLTVGSDFIVNR